MKISVITVCLNEKDTIEETFLSVLNQTYKDFEIIVVDGGSTDGTLDVIEKYKDRITKFISEPDKGIYDAMNKGIDLASGDFLLFLNANDQIYDENVFKIVVDALNKNAEIKFLFGDVECISQDKKKRWIQIYENMNNKYMFLSKGLCHQSTFYHKNLFKEFGKYILDYKICADWEFSLRCLVKNNIYSFYLQSPLAKFYFGGISNSKLSKKQIKKERATIIKYYYPKYCILLLQIVYIYRFLKKHCKFVADIIYNSYPIQKALTYYHKKHKLKNIKKVQIN